MTSSAPKIPVIAPIAQPFFEQVGSAAASSAAAWAATQADAAAENATKHPAIDPAFAAERILGLWPSLASMRDAVLSRFSEDEAAAIAKCFDSLPRLAQALLYVGAQVALEPSKDTSFKDLVADALGLRERGLVSCTLLETLGHVPSGTAAEIRKGRGHQDLAQDLQTLHQTLLPHVEKLASLQAFAAPNTKALSEADGARLSHVGSSLTLRLVRPDAAGPWYVSLLSLISLADRAYTTAITAAHYHLKRLSIRNDVSSAPGTFIGLRRPPAASSSKP